MRAAAVAPAAAETARGAVGIVVAISKIQESRGLL